MNFAARFAVLFLTAMALAACGSTITHDQKIPTSFGNIRYVITSEGGATGIERYQLFYQNDATNKAFFQGENFAEFNAKQKDSKIHIQLCRGRIVTAGPINRRVNEPPVGLDIDWNCKDKTREYQ